MPRTWVHKIKCLQCKLHFTVFSLHENWGDDGITCPECASQGSFMQWREPSDLFIFELVPGSSVQFIVR